MLIHRRRDDRAPGGRPSLRVRGRHPLRGRDVLAGARRSRRARRPERRGQDDAPAHPGARDRARRRLGGRSSRGDASATTGSRTRSPPQGDVLGAFLSGFREVVEAPRRAPARRKHDAASGAPRRARPARPRDRPLPPRARRRARAPRSRRSRATSASPTRDLARPVASLSGGERGRLHLGVVLAQQPDDPAPRRADQPPRPRHDRVARAAGSSTTAAPSSSSATTAPSSTTPAARTMELGRRSLRDLPARSTRTTSSLREDDLERERAPRRAAAGDDRQDRRLHPQEHRRAEDEAGAEPAQDARQARPRRAPGGRVGRRRARRVPLRAGGAHGRHRPRREGALGRARRARRSSTGSTCSCAAASASASSARTARGKTTLLKLLAGRGGADDDGTVKRGTNLQEGYFDQHLGRGRPGAHRRRQRAPRPRRLHGRGGASVPRALPLLGRRPAPRRRRASPAASARASRSPSCSSSRRTSSSSTSPRTTSTSPPPRSSRRRSSASRGPSSSSRTTAGSSRT